MTQKRYYNVKETAEKLGITEDEVKQMLERRELHGYRDGADWKFKVEDIDSRVQDESMEVIEEDDSTGDQSSADVLLSELELGESDIATSGTVIGMESKEASTMSDIQLAGSDVGLAEESPSSLLKDAGDAQTESQVGELDLTLDEDLTLEDSQLGSSSPQPPSRSVGDSGLDLGGENDDDLVLGGSGTGSDVTIGGDSGISLVDPTDSGLSLDEPLELGGSITESLELGEDDMITLGEEADTGAPTQLKSDDDFLLTPMDADEDDEPSSASQVIALDGEGADEDSATMIAEGDSGMGLAVEEDAGHLAGGGFPAVGGQAAMPQSMGMAYGDAALPEAPYSIWNILSLSLCAILLVFCGMFMVDLLRNMWSWSEPFEYNSAMMETVLSWFES